MSALFLFDLVLAVLVSFLLITTAWLSSRRRSVSHIKGPAGAEWLVGECSIYSSRTAQLNVIATQVMSIG